MGEFNLLDLKFILTQRWGMAFGRGFPLMSWQEEIFEREKITPNAIGLFKKRKKIQKLFQWKTLVLSQHKMKNLQDQRSSLG